MVVQPARADLLWMRQGYTNFFNRLSRYQLLNHIPGERCLANKGLLTECLQSFSESQTEFDFTLEDFYQETYCLYDKDQAEKFFARSPAADVIDDLWILKPTSLSQGAGIKIISDRTLAKSVVSDSGSTSPYADESYIAQKYILNPLLLEQRKSELRIYWMIACLEPLQVLIFHEGTVRLNSLPFKLAELDNTLIHVTNVHQQHKHPEFDSETVLKWSFEDLGRYVADTLRLTDEHFIDQELKPQLKQQLAFVVRASLEALRAHPINGLFFGLFGADIILDDQLRPWLTEVQKGPALDFDDPIKQRVIPPMLTEAVSIVTEIQAKLRQGEDLKQLDSVAGFEWVINEA
jgi:hypothetical protein